MKIWKIILEWLDIQSKEKEDKQPKEFRINERRTESIWSKNKFKIKS